MEKITIGVLFLCCIGIVREQGILTLLIVIDTILEISTCILFHLWLLAFLLVAIENKSLMVAWRIANPVRRIKDIIKKNE